MIIRDCIIVTSYGNDSSAVLVYNIDGVWDRTHI